MSSITDLPAFPPLPTDRCYWVAPRLLGGAYPGDVDPEVVSAKLGALADAGVTLWLDLTHPHDGLRPYESALISLGIETLRRIALPVPDLTAAPPEVVDRALEIIDEELAAGGTVYVHCWGGKGRTGTILGCYLARSLGGERALEELNRRRDAQVRHPRDVGVPIPETKAQRDLVRGWVSGDGRSDPG